MKKLLTTTILVSMMATSANATLYTDSYNTYTSTTNQPIANGGNGGAGGNAKSNSKAKSNATGVGLGIAGVNKSGNSKNTNTLKNNQKLLNTIKSSNTQKQGQAQGLINSNKAVNGGNKSRNDNINGALNEGNNSDLKSAVNTDVDIVNKQSRIPVNPAYAPSLTTGTCLGSVSFGIQGGSLGITGGKTTLDKGCDLLRLTKEVAEIYDTKVAAKLLCLQDERVRDALKAETGYDCKPTNQRVTVTYNTNNTCDYPTSQGCGRVGGRR